MQEPTPTVKRDRAPIAILGVPFDSVTLAETLTLAGEMIASPQPHYATTVGVDFLAAAMDDVELRRILFDAHLVMAEDKTVVWASKILGNPLPGSVTVPNLIPQLLTCAEEKKWRVFLLGADSAVAAKVKERHPKLELVGAFAPPDQPLLEMDHAEIRRRLHAVKPDILLVAFGSPKQEKWINMNFREAGVPFVLGAGMSFDFLTGEGKRPAAGQTIFQIYPRHPAAMVAVAGQKIGTAHGRAERHSRSLWESGDSRARAVGRGRGAGGASGMAARGGKQPCDV